MDRFCLHIANQFSRSVLNCLSVDTEAIRARIEILDVHALHVGGVEFCLRNDYACTVIGRETVLVEA